MPILPIISVIDRQYLFANFFKKYLSICAICQEHSLVVVEKIVELYKANPVVIGIEPGKDCL